MIDVVLLNTQAPPTWDGTPISGIAVSLDTTTQHRHIVGSDKLNYFNFQRSEGDLFNRDLANFKSLQTLVDHLSTRGGIVFSVPQVSLLANSHIPIGRFGGLAVEVPNYYLVGIGCYLQGGGTNGSVGVRIVKVSDSSSLASSTAKDEIEWAVSSLAPTTSRGTTLSGANAMEAQLYNDSGVTVVAQGFAIVRPKNS